MRVLGIILNDLFFSSAGFFLGVWYYEKFGSRRENHR